MRKRRIICLALLLALFLQAFAGLAEGGAFTVDMSDVSIKGISVSGSEIASSGMIRSESPINGIMLQLIRCSTGEEVRCIKKRVNGSGVHAVVASKLYSRLHIPKDMGGEDFLIRTTFLSGHDLYVHEKTVRSLAPHYTEADSITSSCTIRPSAAAEPLTDKSYFTCWTSVEKSDAVTVEFPQEAGFMVISWNTASPRFTIRCLSGDGAALGEFTTDEEHRVYRACYELPEGTRFALIRVEAGSGISALRVYPRGDTAHQDQQPLPEKTDLLLFSAHLDDELLWFGGAVPSSAARGKTVGVVYMTKTDWIRRNESLNAMWDCGVVYHPVYLDMQDAIAPSYKAAADIWKPYEPMKLVVRTIRRYKPEVVLTHDKKGEYGHLQHILTSDIVREAVSLAADESYDPDSVSLYGAWQAKKLYIHLSDENPISIPWDDPVNEHGLTSLDLAYAAYDRYVSQHKRYTMDSGKFYDYHAFGLVYSAVGPDVNKNDLFENID